MAYVSIDVAVAAVGAFAAAGGLVFNALAYRAQARAQNLQVITKLDHEITKLESSQLRNTDYRLFGATYLNFCERVAFLATRGIIPENLARYFDDRFAAGLGLLAKPDFGMYRESLGNLVEWCNSKRVSPGPAPAPYTPP